MTEINDIQKYAIVDSTQIFLTVFSGSTGCSLHERICDEEGVPVGYRFLTVNPSFVLNAETRFHPETTLLA